MIYQGKDGELRIYSFGTIYGAEPSGTTYYMEVLFCEMDFNGPISRPRKEDSLKMDRGNFTTDAHYISANDSARYEPIPVTFSCRLNDTVNTKSLSEWISGCTLISKVVGGTTQVYSWDGQTEIDGNDLPAFKDSSKQSYRVEILWDGTTDYAQKYEEVYFTPGEQTITESEDSLILSANGMVYGDVTRITSFTSGTSVLSFS